LAEPEELVAIRALRRGTFSGRPVGSPEFWQIWNDNSVGHWHRAKAGGLAPNLLLP
jgi:hypothetical protein